MKDLKDFVELAMQHGAQISPSTSHLRISPDQLAAFAEAIRAEQAQRIAELEADNAHYLKVIEDRSREAHQWWSALQDVTKNQVISSIQPVEDIGVANLPPIGTPGYGAALIALPHDYPVITPDARQETVTPAMIKAGKPWITGWQHMNNATREANLEEAYKAMRYAAIAQQAGKGGQS
jgi:hypothetical protein